MITNNLSRVDKYDYKNARFQMAFGVPAQP